ncbi:MAG: glycosyltransferase [Patescibacteria group bacterium]
MQRYFAKYYHSYLDSLVDFLIPRGKRVLRLGIKIEMEKSVKYDYVVLRDVLGYVYDVQNYFKEIKDLLTEDGRIIITQYSAFWEPVLRLASFLGLRKTLKIEQNWLSMHDLQNFAHLADLDMVKSGTKMIMPLYIPLFSSFLNKIVVNFFPFSRLGLFHYIVLKKNRNSLHLQATIKAPSISIVVPARNEAGTIEKIARDLPKLGNFTEIIFIEGNSTDNTYDEIVRVANKYKDSKKIKYGKQKGKGKGDAVRLGFEMAEGDILTIFDADMTVPAEEMGKFYDAIVEGKGDFINGSRLVYPLEKDSMRVLNFIANKFFSLAFSYLLGQRLKDTLCGTKVLWKKDYESIKNNRAFFGDFDPFGDFDLLFGAAKLNLKIIDLPIHYKERAYGVTNISRFRHGWLLLKMVVFAARKIKFI